jgi:hypothetical protein
VPASTWTRPPTGNLVPLGRVAQVHRQRPAEWHEGLILRAFGVAWPDGAGLVADEVRAGVAQAGEPGERCAKASRVVVVLVPLELLGFDDVERNGVLNDAVARAIPTGDA